MKKILFSFFLAFASITSYAQTTEVWTTKAPMLTATCAAGTAVVDNIIYVIGGSSPTTLLSTVEAYNPITNTWTTKNSMPTARIELGVAAVNGKIYAIGGYNGSPLNNVEQYDPSTDIWTTKASMPTARSLFSVGVIGNNIYAVGGWPGNIATLEVYNTVTNTWTTKTPVPTGRQQINGCVVIDGKLHFIGGKNNYNTIFYANNDVYDTLTDTWSTAPNLPFSRYEGAAVLIYNSIYYLGGSENGNGFPNYQNNNVYDTTTNTWISKLQMLNKRAKFVAGAVNGEIYVTGGYDSLGNIVNWNQEYFIDNNPIFFVGTSQSLSVCQNSTANSIDSIMSVTDIDTGQTITWSVITGAVHGTVTASYSTTSTGGTLYPVGIIYTPTIGYTGIDSFTIQVTDSFATTNKKIIVTVNPVATAGTISGSISFFIGNTVTLSDTITGGTWSATNGNATVSSGGIVLGNTVGIDTINYSEINSCSSIASYVVNILMPICSSIITTFAGNGTAGDSGDGSNATSATLNNPVGVCADNMGNIYIADYLNQCIRKVNSSGVITTIAGNGSGGYSGDGGPAISASLFYPTGVAVDYLGNVFIADWNNNRIRKVNTSGIISTYAGNGTYGYSGDGGAATAAQIKEPSGVGVDRLGNVFIADGYNNNIRKVSTSGIITTFAGNGSNGYGGDGGAATSAQLSNPCGVAIDSMLNVYIASSSSVRKVNTSGIISTIAGNGIDGSSGDGGAATSASVSVWGVAVDKNGNIFFNDVSYNKTRKVNNAGIINTIVGTGTAGYSGDGGTSTSAQINSPWGIAVDNSGNVYIGDAGNQRVRKVTVSNSAIGYITGFLSVCVGETITLSDTTLGGTWSVNNNKTTISSTGVVTGVYAGLDTIQYTVTNSCGTATVTHIVTINPLPIEGSITGSSTVCAGSNITLSDAASGGTWSANNSFATVIGGVVSGISTGIDTITYTISNSCGSASVTKIITVNLSISVDSISGTSNLCIGSIATLSVTTTGGIWSATNSNVTITGGIVTGATSGIDTIQYSVTSSCGTATATHIVTINPLPNAGSITGTSTVCAGATTTLTNTITGGTWSAANTHASITNGGIVTGISTGIDTITYTITNACGSASVTKVITVNPALSVGSIAGLSNICVGATVTLSDTTTGGTWSATNAHASVTGGIVTGISTGIDTIAYTFTNTCGIASLTKIVTVNPLLSVGSIVGLSNICISATITLFDTTAGGTWSATNTHASITNGGIVTGISTGIDTITYTITNTCGSATVTKVITVNPSLSIGSISGTSNICIGSTATLSDTTTGGTWGATNSNVTFTGGIITGATLGIDTIQYTVTSSCGSAVVTKVVTVNPPPSVIIGLAAVCPFFTITLSDVGSGTWYSSTATIATVSGSGVVTGVSPGVDTIKYTLGTGCTTTKLITVYPFTNAGVITGLDSMCTGTTLTLVDTNFGGAGEWLSADTSIATVSGGVVTGVSAGNVNISYSGTYGCSTGTSHKTITINPLPNAGTITGATTVCAGSTTSLTDASSGGTWSLVATGVATINSSGLVTGVSAGTTIISYTVTNTCGTAIATMPITINPLPIAGTIIAADSLCAGANTTLLSTSGGGVWSCSNTRASVSGAVLTGASAGLDTIKYTVTNTCGTDFITKPIIIKPSPFAGSIAGLDSVCVGTSITLTNATTGGVWSLSNSRATNVAGTVTGVNTGLDTVIYTFTNYCGTANTTKPLFIKPLPNAGTITGGTTLCAAAHLTLADATTGGVWSSINSDVSVTGTGVVTGVAAGVDTIQYAVTNSCSTAIATHYITVNPLPNAGTITGSGTVCVGDTAVLTETVTGGTWSSSNTLTATVTSGVITGIATGTATITYTYINSCGLVFTTLPITIGTTLTPTISGFSYVCIGGNPDTLSGSPADGVWTSTNTNAIVSGGIVIGITEGWDTLIYAVTNTCGTHDTSIALHIYTHVECELSTENKVVTDAAIKIYPNPTTGAFTIELPEVGNNTTITIIDLLGKEIVTQQITDHKEPKIEFNLNQVASGTYLIKVTTDGKTYRGRVVIW